MRKVGMSVPTFHKRLSDFKGLRAQIAGIAYRLLKWQTVLFLLHCARMRILRKLSTYTIPACHYITERLKWILNADNYKHLLCRTIKCKRLEIGVIRPFLHLGLQAPFMMNNW